MLDQIASVFVLANKGIFLMNWIICFFFTLARRSPKYWTIDSLISDISLNACFLLNCQSIHIPHGMPPFSSLQTDTRFGKDSATTPSISSTSKRTAENSAVVRKEAAATKVPEELFVPGTVYYLKRNVETQSSSSNSEGREFFTLHRRHPGEHFQRIVLSSNLISAHKCDSHYYALRDVLKGLPVSPDEGSF